jgi:hypothetical protein
LDKVKPVYKGQEVVMNEERRKKERAEELAKEKKAQEQA